jgi:tRNA threonylcarbamoyladenosine modification (KEOPS) complex  Pcc1 subunit
MSVDSWREWTDMSVKQWFNKKYDYSYLGGVDRIGWSGSVVRSILPELKQRGMRKSCHGISPYKLCFSLLNNNRIETLFKLKQYLLVGYLCWNPERFDDDMWQTIRVALRHGYHWDNVQELKDWMDMLRDLKDLNLDIRNPHYICPANLHEAHQHWIEVREKIRQKECEAREREREARKMQQAIELEQTYKEKRSCFVGMVITDGEISISVIPTPQAMIEEGKAMHHCVGGYVDRWDSLILSAKIDGNRIETIEVDLKDYHIEQSRGVCNEETEYHNRIIGLLNSNMGEIKRRYRKQLRKAA